ncbi:hypothetical protein ACUNWD_09130 [Sunxiuqinia sp. A32]|uniref:hypothetical protein n=1 Tax=Sunxiuqinia sp. A32 TaxID=3461496 RepID=UPI00404535F0
MSKRRKLNTNEKLLISFIIVLILAIAFNWKSFSERLKASFGNEEQKEIPVK